jgi:tRNA nucleotidyltransferase (CCA-adding enzyme)
MQDMVTQGEIDHLVPERVWAETAKALSEQSPAAYFQALRDCGALARIFPELDALFGVPQPAKHHPEIDTGVHVLVLHQCLGFWRYAKPQMLVTGAKSSNA